jgi:release factor glutamine methyltransferase
VRQGVAHLARHGIRTAPHDAEVLLAHVLGVERVRLHTHPEQPVPAPAAQCYRGLIERRAAREPLQYLTGVQEFWSLRFRVSPAVLIPRPETEHLIECCLRLNARLDPLILDIGTGSGCLAIVAAREIPGAGVQATDISPAAIEVARDNAVAHGVADRIVFHEGDLFAPLRGHDIEGRADFILSNPPYIGEQEIETLAPEVRDNEPRAALSPGHDPLGVHRRLAAQAGDFLRPGGYLIVEIGQGQDEALRNMYGAVPSLEVLGVPADLSGIPRVLCARARQAILGP